MSSLNRVFLSGVVVLALAAYPAYAQDTSSNSRPQRGNNDQVDLSTINPNNNNPVSRSTDNLTGTGIVSGTSDTSIGGTGEVQRTGPFGATDSGTTGNAYRGWWIGGAVLACLIAVVVLFNVWRKPDSYSRNLRAGGG